MKRITVFAVAWVALMGLLPTPADALFPGHADHQLLCGAAGCPTNPDTAVYCGSNQAPYMVSWEATAGSLGGEVRLVFKDLDFIRYKIPANTSFHAEHILGGVTGVDEVVKLEPDANIEAMMVSVFAGRPARDQFDERLDGAAAERFNYCVTCSSAGGTNDPGCTSATTVIP